MRLRRAAYFTLLISSHLPAQILPADATITASAVDSAGSIYLAGNTYSADLPSAPGVFEPNAPQNICDYFQGQPEYCEHAFVAKLPPSGDRLLWASYLQGNGSDTISAMAVDAAGRIFVAGSTTSTTLLLRPDPFSPGPYQIAAASLFLYQISSDGRYLVHGTFFGGSAKDSIADIKLDAAGHIYIAGTAVSDPFPTTPGSYQQVRDKTFYDQFAAEFDSSLSQLIFSTLIGQGEATGANVLALGADGTVYVGGGIGEFPISPIVGPILTRLSADGTSLLYSTLLPNTSQFGVQLGIFSLAVDSNGNAYAGTDNHTFYEPGNLFGTISKLDPQGNIVASQDIGGDVLSLALGAGGTLFAFGYAQWNQLGITPGATAACAGLAIFIMPSPGLPYVAEADSATLTVSYAGYMTGGISQVAPGHILVGTGLGFFSVSQAGPPPAGTITCMANAASGDVSAIVPGELVMVTGNQIGPEQPAGPVVDSEGNISSNIGGFSVWIAGLPAPLLYASSNQLNLVVPFGIPISRAVPVQLRENGTVISTFHQTGWTQDPGLFTTNSADQLAALNQDGSVNSPNNPARKGSIVSIFATGLGAMIPQPPDGSRPSEPAAVPVNCPGVSVGDQGAEIEYCGNAPGLVEGVVQINFRVPADVTAASPSSHAVYVSIVSSNPGTIAVQ